MSEWREVTIIACVVAIAWLNGSRCYWKGIVKEHSAVDGWQNEACWWRKNATAIVPFDEREPDA
jgi:hypothetical protein